MDKEKLKQANEKLQVIKNLESQIQKLIRISKKTARCSSSFYLWAGDKVAIPRELESVFNALLGDYYRRELEKAKKEFEEM
jgi:hypothetical protein